MLKKPSRLRLWVGGRSEVRPTHFSRLDSKHLLWKIHTANMQPFRSRYGLLFCRNLKIHCTQNKYTKLPDHAVRCSFHVSKLPTGINFLKVESTYLLSSLFPSTVPCIYTVVSPSRTLRDRNSPGGTAELHGQSGSSPVQSIPDGKHKSHPRRNRVRHRSGQRSQLEKNSKQLNLSAAISNR